MTSTFNLSTEPWIPCERLDGTRVELSTLETLAQAHELRAIDDASPLVHAVLHRHLLAVLHRSYAGPRTMKEWVAIASGGKFDRARVDAYLTSVRDRMDLFHPTHPFAQTRGLIAQFGAEAIDELEIERSSWGSARELFQHRPGDARPEMNAARAARALLAHQAFATGGLVRKLGEPTSATGAPLVRCAVVLLRGATLFDTLRVNFLRYDAAQNLPIPGDSSDAPAWEQPPPPSKLPRADEPKRIPKGWLDSLTWLSRRIELVEDHGHVTAWVRAVGQGMADGSPRDPMVTYRADEKRGLVSVGMNPARAFWRSAHALFEADREGVPGRFERPCAISLVATPQALDVLGASAAYTLDVLGLAAEKSKVEMVRGERIHARACTFNDPAARDAVERSVRIANEAVFALRMALRSYARHALSPGERQPDGKDVSAFVDSTNAEPSAWSALGVAFDELMRALAASPDEAEAAFAARALAIVRREFELATSRSATTARWLKARAIAERSLSHSLSSLSLRDSAPSTPTAPEVTP